MAVGGYTSDLIKMLSNLKISHFSARRSVFCSKDVFFLFGWNFFLTAIDVHKIFSVPMTELVANLNLWKLTEMLNVLL